MATNNKPAEMTRIAYEENSSPSTSQGKLTPAKHKRMKTGEEHKKRSSNRRKGVTPGNVDPKPVVRINSPVFAPDHTKNPDVTPREKNPVGKKSPISAAVVNKVKEEEDSKIQNSKSPQATTIQKEVVEKAASIVKKWAESTSSFDLFDYLKHKAGNSKAINLKYKETESSIEKAEEVLLKLDQLDDASEITSVCSEPDPEENHEFSLIEDKKRYLEGVWDSLKLLCKETELARFLHKKDLISAINKEVFEKNLVKGGTDTMITVIKMKHYKLKMRIVVAKKPDVDFTCMFVIMKS